ncbi:Protein of unknown function [Pyronema omphalodes CBS 100304]|uniref:Uncharacterized protein n=1 Tax=Pyronema omphalodes (strain CBS 100304) TaxID=1076935 RepID=U4LN94_PYROM|nr:Protein of unknown function [Pyronema omphalodes CBS 100304]
MRTCGRWFLVVRYSGKSKVKEDLEYEDGVFCCLCTSHLMDDLGCS